MKRLFSKSPFYGSARPIFPLSKKQKRRKKLSRTGTIGLPAPPQADKKSFSDTAKPARKVFLKKIGYHSVKKCYLCRFIYNRIALFTSGARRARGGSRGVSLWAIR
jgi:hypothetical protein